MRVALTDRSWRVHTNLTSRCPEKLEALDLQGLEPLPLLAVQVLDAPVPGSVEPTRAARL